MREFKTRGPCRLRANGRESRSKGRCQKTIAVLPAEEWRKAVPRLRGGQDTLSGVEGRAMRVLDAFFFEEL